MTEKPTDNGLSFLSKLDQYWVKHKTPLPVPLANEQLIALSQEHWIKYVFPTFLYVVLTTCSALLFYVSAITTDSVASVFFIVALVLLFITHHWFFWFLLAETEAHIIVTNKRLIYIHETLLLKEEMVEVSFEKMKTVEAHKTNFLQSVFNYGTLQFETAAKIHRVPHPGTLARQIEQAMGMI